MGNKEAHESNPPETPEATICSRVRTPSYSRLRRFGGKAAKLLGSPRPKLKLALGLYELTDSPAFAWRASSSICRALGISSDSVPRQGETERELIVSALKLIGAALKSSKDHAYVIASEIGNFEGCRRDHLALFFKMLGPIAKESPEAALDAMRCFHKGSASAYLLCQYSLALECANKKGDLETMGMIAGLFFDFARFPESARIMLESYVFWLGNIGVRDAESFTRRFCEDWRKSLASDVFAQNPD